MSWNDFQNKLIRMVREVMWAQWGALGIKSSENYTPVAVDLEALLLGTWAFGRTDPRLFDEALSWCAEYADVANTKRIKKLLEHVDDESTLRVAATWQDFVNERSDGHWSVAFEDLSSPDGPERLFFTEELEPQSVGRARDEWFDERGLCRGPFESRRGHRAPELQDPAVAQLFSRKFMGGGCRAEIFSLLLQGASLTTSEFAKATLYSRRSVQQVLGDLKSANIVDWEGGRGRTTRVSLREPFEEGMWSGLHPGEPYRDPGGYLSVRDWPGFYLGLHALWRVAVRITREGYGEFKAQSLLRDALEEAFEYHNRTSDPSVYRPKLAADSLDKLIVEAQTYLDTLFTGLTRG